MSNVSKTPEYLAWEKEIRLAICQYCLDQGHGIYDPNKPQDPRNSNLGPAMTTQKEIDTVEKLNRRNNTSEQPRCVYVAQIDYYMNHPRFAQICEAVSRDYDLCDLDEWQLLQDLLGVELSFVHAGRINHILWSKEDLSVRDLDWDDPDAKRRLYDFLYKKIKDETFAEIDNILKENCGVDIRLLHKSRHNVPDHLSEKISLPEYPKKG